MVAKVWEAARSQLGDGKQIVGIWNTREQPDESTAVNEVLSAAPGSFLRNGILYWLNTHDVRVTERFRAGCWQIELPYRTGNAQANRQYTPPVQGEWTFEITTTGATRRIKNIWEEDGETDLIKAFGQGDPAVDLTGTWGPVFGNCINVTGTGDQMQVEGLDVIVPSFKFNCRAVFPNATLDMAYAKKAAEYTGKINSAIFPPNNMPFVGGNHFQPGEVLFLGADLAYQPQTDLTITLSFEMISNITSFSIGPIKNISATKRGHDYVWVHYEKFDDAALFITTLQPKVAYIHKVYPERDLNALFTGIFP